MRRLHVFATLALACGLGLCSSAAFGNGINFSDFTPLPSSAGPTSNEAAPITLGNPRFQQRTLSDRATQLGQGEANTGNWDMNTTNETGLVSRFLFTVFETGQAGVQRTEISTGRTDTIWFSPAPAAHVAFDASFWTPWGTYITAEESWTTAAAGATTSPYGRLFELKNPLTAPAIVGTPTATSNQGALFVHQNIIPRVSHEGIQFDRAGNMYFIDELDGGNIYRYTTAADMRLVRLGRANYFAAGQTSVLRVGDGATANATGAYTWVPITNENGAPLPGALVITDPNGVRSLDGRNTTNLAAFRGTDYQRPEDLEIQVVNGQEFLYIPTTTTHEVYRLDLAAQRISVFANRSTINVSTGAAIGDALANPDNVAVDNDGNLYIVEDRNGGVDDDIWFARDLNRDGDLLDPGEGLARWASNGTLGSEFTGLYFDPRNSRRAWVNIQHPTSGNDRTIEITVPRR